MTDFFFLEREREEGKKRSTYADHSLRLLTCLQQTARVQLAGLSEPRYTKPNLRPRGHIYCGCAISLYLSTACTIFFALEIVKHEGEGTRTALAFEDSRETRAGGTLCLEKYGLK